MKEAIISFFIVLLFSIASYFLHRYMRKIKSAAWLTAVILMYLVTFYFYFAALNKLHQYLRDKGIYIEVGHASILLVELFFLCFLIALANSIWAVVKRNKSSAQQ